MASSEQHEEPGEPGAVVGHEPSTADRDHAMAPAETETAAQASPGAPEAQPAAAAPSRAASEAPATRHAGGGGGGGHASAAPSAATRGAAAAASAGGVDSGTAPARDQQRSKKHAAASRNRKGGRGAAAGGAAGSSGGAEEAALPDKLDLVKLRYEPKRTEPQDDPSRVTLSKAGKATALELSEDRLSVTGRKGFRSARASHGTHGGAWYCEATVTHLGPTGHCRLGWLTRKAELQAPVGFDLHGFAYRDLEGSKVCEGRREAYGEPYGEGDVVGLYIYLPEGGRSLENDSKQLVRWKGRWMRVEEEEEPAAPLKGSVIAFSKNGVPQGVAFRDFLEGRYYPAAALYTLPEQQRGATVTFNFGPNFKHAPPLVEGCPEPRPMCAVVEANAALAAAATAAAAPAAAAAVAPRAAAAVETAVVDAAA